MNWEALGAIGEIIGATAVLITLIYLAIQIRQNTEQVKQSSINARAAAINASTISLRENRNTVFADRELSNVLRRGLIDPKSLDEDELFRFRLILLSVSDALCDVYNQAHVTSFAPETWQYQGITVAWRILGSPGGRWFWDEYRSNYAPAFQSEIDKILADSGDA